MDGERKSIPNFNVTIKMDQIPSRTETTAAYSSAVSASTYISVGCQVLENFGFIFEH
jgi:hypothetical protein